MIMCAMKEIERVTSPCVKFRPARENDKDWILIRKKKKASGCNSGMGYYGKI